MDLNLKRIPLEVVEIILSNLEAPDLLNCRLVSRDWNQECLKQLRKSKGRKCVEHENIDGVLEFVKKSSANTYAEPWVLPFEVHMTFNEDDLRITEPGYPVPDIFTQQVASLIEQVPGSVLGVVLRGHCPRRENTFRDWVQVLGKCSAHLKNLNIWLRRGLWTPMSMSSAVNVLRHENLIFPQLKILSINYNWRGSEIVQESLAHVLVQQSPNIEDFKLTVSVNSNENIWSEQFQRPKLKRLSVRQHIGDSSDLMKRVPAPHSIPNLESLRLFPVQRQFENELTTQALRIILLSFSTKLKFLTIDNFAWRPNLIGALVTVTRLKFPTLPSLEHLQVGLWHNQGVPAYANLEEFNFCQANFPALRSVDTELGFYLGMPTLPIQTFDSVERLRLRLKGSEDYSLISVQEYCRAKKRIKLYSALAFF